MPKQNAACDNAKILPCAHKLNQASINTISCQKHCTLKLNDWDSKQVTYEKSESNGMTSED